MTALKRLNDKQVEVVCSKDIDGCGKTYVLNYSADQQAIVESGGHIQNVARNLDDGERELLISGFCGACFDALFADEDDDPDYDEGDDGALF